MKTLPPLPPTIRTLSPGSSDRLKRIYPRLWADPNKTCVTCSKNQPVENGPFVFLAPGGVETECDCRSQWRLHRYLLNSGVLLSYQRISWDDVDNQVPAGAIDAIVEYVENAERYVNAGMGLILGGTPGTGKTLLATLLFKRLLENGHDGYFTQFNQLLDAYTAGWQDKDDREWFTRRVANAGVLVIDDIGKEGKGRENVTNPMFDMVIRSRVADDKPTIITTNYALSEMQAGYGGPVMSLLTEACFDHEVTGLDFRERARKRQQEELKAGIVRPVVLS
jgi:DNA replication protein DnaC